MVINKNTHIQPTRCPQDVEQLVTGYFVKSQVIHLKPHVCKISSHFEGWCGLGQRQSPDDFDGLNITRSQFLAKNEHSE